MRERVRESEREKREMERRERWRVSEKDRREREPNS